MIELLHENAEPTNTNYFRKLAAHYYVSYDIVPVAW